MDVNKINKGQHKTLKAMKYAKIVVMGPPGSGKGTQSKLISEKYKIRHVSSGDIVREEIKKGK